MAICLQNVTIRLDFHYSWEGGVSPSHVLLIIVIAKTLKKSFMVQDLEMAIWLQNVTIRLDFHYSWEGWGVVSHSHVLLLLYCCYCKNFEKIFRGSGFRHGHLVTECHDQVRFPL